MPHNDRPGRAGPIQTVDPFPQIRTLIYILMRIRSTAQTGQANTLTPPTAHWQVLLTNTQSAEFLYKTPDGHLHATLPRRMDLRTLLYSL
jgi:hypothetical protein